MSRGFLVNQSTSSDFWQLVSRLSGSKIYDKQIDLVPYTPNSPLTYVNFQPAYSVGAILSIFLNDKYIGNTKIIDSNGTYYFDIYPPYGIFTIKTYLSDLTTLLQSDQYNATNFALFFSVLATQFQELDVELQAMRGDLTLANVRDNKLYGRFGWFFNFQQPNYMTPAQYRAVVAGSVSTSQPGFMESFLYGSTVKGLSDTIQSITGVAPVVSTYRTTFGWTLYTTFPEVPQIYAFGVPSPPGLPTILYSKKWKAWTLLVQVYNSIVPVTNEVVFKQTQDGSGNPNIDNLQNQNLTSTTVVITQGSNTYVEGTNFTVNRVAGTISWIDGQSQPAEFTMYFATYSFYMKALIEQQANAVKPAQFNLIFEYMS
jgi:hypothetical protein